MPLGLSDKLDVLLQSPHDCLPAQDEPEEPIAAGETKWLPSHYNVRAVTDDGKLVLWNTYHGTLTVFEPEQKTAIASLLRPEGFRAPEEGVVSYLYRRGYLIEQGTNEFQQLQLSFGQQQYRSDVLQLILLASEDCNFRCSYCYERFARGTMEPWVQTGIKNFVRGRLPGLRTLLISWFGGEPLYGFSAIENLSPFFKEVTDERNIQFTGDMTTNGYLLTPEVAGKLLSWGIRRYQITIDGPPECHNRSRPTRTGDDTFEVILNNLIAMRAQDEDFRVNLRVNFDRDNHPEMDRFFDLFEEALSGDARFRLRFRAVGRWGGEDDEKLNVCGTKEGSDVYVQLKYEAWRRGLTLVEDDDLRKLQGINTPMVCYAARPYNFIIGASGKIMKCTIDLDYEDSNVIGQISEAGDLVLDRNKFAAWTEPAFEQDSKCGKCVVLPLCQGISCPRIRIRTQKSPCLPLRSAYKQELRAVAEFADLTNRRVQVHRT